MLDYPLFPPFKSQPLSFRLNTSLFIVTSLVVTILVGIGHFLGKYWINFPFLDDYQTIIDFLNHTKTDSITRLITYTVWLPHNEHRIVIPRIIATISAYLSPSGLRLDLLCASGLLFRILILVPLYRQWADQFAQSNGRAWLVCGFTVPIFVILSGRDMENFMSATCALQNIPVITWALLAFMAASRSNWPIAWTMGILATLTSGNGIIVLLVLSSDRLVNRRWLVGSVTIVSSLIGYWFYRSGTHSAIDLHHWGTVLPKFFAFQGSVSYLHFLLHEYKVPYTTVTVLIGLLYTGVGVETVWSYWRGRISVFYPAIFLFNWLTAFSVALLRPGVLESRFALYSMVLTAVVYARFTAYLSRYHPRWIPVMHILASMASVIFFVLSFVVYSKTAQRRYRTTLAEYYTLWHNDSPVYNQPRHKLRMLESVHLYSTALVDQKAQSIFTLRAKHQQQRKASLTSNNEGYALIHTTEENDFLVFEQGKNCIALPTDTHEDIPPFTTFFMYNWLPKGSYQVKIITRGGWYLTNMTINNVTDKKQQLAAERHTDRYYSVANVRNRIN